MATPQWLLLAHQLPTRPSNARVKTWRRLQQIGAVVTRNSVYVLPNTEQCREDFEWLRSEIVDFGGEATVFAADVVDGRGSSDLVAAFRQARGSDYAALKAEADRIAAAARRNGRRGVDRAGTARALRGIRDRFAEIDRIDFFHAPGRDELVTMMSAIERLIHPPLRQPAERPAAKLRAGDYVKRRWVTRPRPGVDRMASAWLIRTFIDPKATFAFVNKPAPADVAFDMYEGEFSHRGPYCTYEVLTQRFGIDTPAVVHVGHIVHDLDMKEARYGVAEAPAIERMIEGLRALHRDDHELLEHGMRMFAALARAVDSPARGPERPRRPSRKVVRRRTR